MWAAYAHQRDDNKMECLRGDLHAAKIFLSQIDVWSSYTKVGSSAR